MISIRKELVEDCIENIRCLLNEIIELRYYGGNDRQCKIYEAEIAELEAALQSHNSARAEICSDSICAYCVCDCKTEKTVGCRTFTGRKLSPVA